MNDRYSEHFAYEEAQQRLEMEDPLRRAFSHYARENGYRLDEEYLALSWSSGALDRWLVARNHPSRGFQILGVTILTLSGQGHDGDLHVTGFCRSEAATDPCHFIPALEAIDRHVSGIGQEDLPPLDQGEWRHFEEPAPGPEDWQAVRYVKPRDWREEFFQATEERPFDTEPGYVCAEDADAIREPMEWGWASDDSDMGHVSGGDFSEDAPDVGYNGP